MEKTLKQKEKDAMALIREYVAKYPNYSVSYSGGKDSEVVMHLVARALNQKNFPAFAVMSSTEFDETVVQVRTHENEDIKIYEYENKDPNGPNCCRESKVDKFKEAVADLDMWFAGIRKDEGLTRADFQPVEDRDGLIKVNPILEFTEKDIWRYIGIHGIKVNPRYKDGYRSLSCRYCSVVEQDGAEDERAGRWKGTEHAGTECGIHTQTLRK